MPLGSLVGTVSVAIGHSDDPISAPIVVVENHDDPVTLCWHVCHVFDECTFGLGQEWLIPEQRVEHRAHMQGLIIDTSEFLRAAARERQPRPPQRLAVAKNIVATLEGPAVFEYESVLRRRLGSWRHSRCKPAHSLQELPFPRSDLRHATAMALADRLLERCASVPDHQASVVLRMAWCFAALEHAYGTAGVFWQRPALAATAPDWPRGGPAAAIRSALAVSDAELERYATASTSN